MPPPALAHHAAFDLPPSAGEEVRSEWLRGLLGELLHEWSPVIGRDLRPLGVRVQIRRSPGATAVATESNLAMALDAVLTGFVNEGGVSFPHGLVLLAPQDMKLDVSMLTWRPPRNVVVELSAAALSDEESLRFLFEVHRSGVRFALRLKSHEALPEASRLALFHYVLMDAARVQGMRPPVRMGDALVLVLDEGNVTQAQEVLSAQVHGVVGWALLTPTPTTEHALAPMQQAVLDLIRLAQSDADVEALETAFKAEPVLAYMLLTLANSPAFIRTTPIASLRHAITLLGYRRLVKWLVLLIVVASKSAKALPQIYGAVARGFFMENLAIAHRASPNTQDECFVVGAFSLLGAITGQTLPSLLQQVTLPANVVDALLHRQGPLAGYLNLALTVESAAASQPEHVVRAAHDAHLEIEAVNRALLQALSATDALQSAI